MLDTEFLTALSVYEGEVAFVKSHSQKLTNNRDYLACHNIKKLLFIFPSHIHVIHYVSFKLNI